DLSWFDTSVNEDGFKIQRAADEGGSPGTWEQIGTVGANVTNYRDAGVVTNATYWYRVQSYNTCGDSPYSYPAIVSVAAPVAPDSLSATLVATNQVQVNLYWYAGSGNEAGYKIERAPDVSGSPGTWMEIKIQ